MFFYSSEHAEVEQVRKELMEAGIPCEVRDMVPTEGMTPGLPEAELWIRNDEDSHRALMLCVAHGVGFAKRVLPPDWFAERTPEHGDEPAANGKTRTREGSEEGMLGEQRSAA